MATTTYDAGNRLTQWGTSTLSYDFNGNLTNDGTKTYTWNVRDQLASMTGASFQYDAQGRRHRRVVSSTTRDFVYDGLNLVQEKQNTTVKANVLTGLGLDELFTRIEGSTTRHLLADALGSTLALTDPAGAVQTQYTYAPFGATTASGPTNTNPFKFTGREDDGTGLYYYRARYYHPGLSRFISEDPIGFASSDLNFYEYVGSAPTAYTDPLGLEKCCGGFDCFLKCVAIYRWDWKWLTGFNLGNAAANAAAGGTGRTGVGGTPPHSTSWQHKVGGALGGATGSRFGRAIGRGAVIPTIGEGYYDVGVFLACGWICAGCGR